MAQVSTKDSVAHGTSVAEHCTQRAFRSDMHVTISLSVFHVLFVRWESKTPASNTPLSCGSDFYSKSFVHCLWGWVSEASVRKAVCR